MPWLALLGCIPLPGAARPAAPLTAAEILRRSVVQGERVPITAQLSFTQWNDHSTVATLSHYAQDSLGRYRQTYDAPRGIHGRILIYDGRRLWQVEPRRKAIVVRDMVAPAADAKEQLVRLLLQNYTVQLLGPGRAAGRPSYVLRLVPHHAGKGSQRRWVDRKTFRTLRTETRFPDGTLAYSMRYFDVDLPAKLSDALFRPPATKALKIQAKTGPQAPLDQASLRVEAARCSLPVSGPLGFRLERGTREQDGAFHAVYFDGLETISVFVYARRPLPTHEPPGWTSIMTRKGRILQHSGKHTNMLTWSRRGFRYTAVSHLLPNAFLDFVGSLP